MRFIKKYLQRFQTRSNHPNPPASSPRAGRTHSLRYCGSVICEAWNRRSDTLLRSQLYFKLMDPLPSCWCHLVLTPFGSTASFIGYIYILVSSDTKAISKMVIYVPNHFTDRVSRFVLLFTLKLSQLSWLDFVFLVLVLNAHSRAMESYSLLLFVICGVGFCTN